MTHSVRRAERCLLILDPEFSVASLSDLPVGEILVIANPCQERDLATLGRSFTRAQFDMRATHERFNEVALTLIEHKHDTVSLRGLWGKSYDVSLGLFLETGHALDLYVLLDTIFEGMAEFFDGFTSFCVLSTREEFSAAASSSLRARGLSFEVVFRGDVPGRSVSASKRSVGAVVDALAGMFLGMGKPRVLTLGHRQNLSVNNVLSESKDVYMIDSLLLGVMSLLVKSSGHEAPLSRDDLLVWLLGMKVEGAVWGRYLWEAFCRGQCDALVRQLDEGSVRFKVLDIFKPAFILAPGWSGAELYTYRVWSIQNKRIFGAIQHGFQHGTRLAPKTTLINADIFYIWGDVYINRWMALDKNERVTFVASGDPNGLSVPDLNGLSDQGDHKSILIAPSSCLEFGRGRFVEFWEHMFGLIDERPDFHWSIRIHNLLRNDTWLMGEASKRGVVVETTSMRTLQDALGRCDIVITSVSAMAVNAMQMKRAAVIVNITKEPEFFSDFIAASVVADYAKIEGCIDDVVMDYERYVQEQGDFYDLLCKNSDATQEIASDVIARSLAAAR